jgi:hypothetical protein
LNEPCEQKVVLPASFNANLNGEQLKSPIAHPNRTIKILLAITSLLKAAHVSFLFSQSSVAQNLLYSD